MKILIHSVFLERHEEKKCYRRLINWKSPIGYSIAVVTEYLLFKQIYFFTAVLSCLEIGIYLLMMGTLEDVEHDSSSLNGIAKSEENPSKILERFRVNVRFHSTVEQLS